MIIDYFVKSILAAVSVSFMSSRDTTHRLVLSQIASSVGCAANSSLTIVVGCKQYFVILPENQKIHPHLQYYDRLYVLLRKI